MHNATSKMLLLYWEIRENAKVSLFLQKPSSHWALLKFMRLLIPFRMAPRVEAHDTGGGIA